jgi:hypothetical protein
MLSEEGLYFKIGKRTTQQQLIIDMAVFLRNDNITSKIIYELQAKVKCPLPLYVKPIKINNCINHFSKYLIKIIQFCNLVIYVR